MSLRIQIVFKKKIFLNPNPNPYSHELDLNEKRKYNSNQLIEQKRILRFIKNGNPV